MGTTVKYIPFTDQELAITVTECSAGCSKFINRTVTLREFADFTKQPTNVFELIGNNGVEIRFETHHGEWIQGDAQ